MDLTPEQHLLLLLSRLNPLPEALRDAEAILKNSDCSINYDVMMKLAAMNGVTPLLYHNMKTLEGIPEKTMNELRSAYLYTAKENIEKAAEVMRLLSSLGKHSIDAIPLKGPVASDIIFGNLGLYPSSDIDLLVRPADLDKAKNALRAAGYSEIPAMAEEDQLQGGYHISLRKQDYIVELHWNLVMRYFASPPDFWWEGALKSEYEGTEITLLSPERYLLYGIFRLFSHGFRPLRFLVLVSGLAEKYREQIRWSVLLSLAQDLKMIRVTLFTLKLLGDLLGSGVPQHISDRRVYGYDLLKKLVTAGLFREVKRTRARMSLFTSLLDTPLDTAGVLLRRVFPNLSEIRLRYGLPAGSKKVYLYYLANPLLLLIKRR